MEKHELDEIIEKYIRANAQGNEIITGWMLCMSVRHPAMGNSDGYIVDNSDGLPYDSQIGLLTASLDEKRNVILSQVINEGKA